MKNRIYYLAIIILLILFAYFSYQIIIGVRPLRIVFLDVRQGDSILIQKGSRQILIDGGPSGKVELAKPLEYLKMVVREEKENPVRFKMCSSAFNSIATTRPPGKSSRNRKFPAGFHINAQRYRQLRNHIDGSIVRVAKARADLAIKRRSNVKVTTMSRIRRDVLIKKEFFLETTRRNQGTDYTKEEQDLLDDVQSSRAQSARIISSMMGRGSHAFT